MTKLSWNDIEKITDELVERIKADQFTPDYIIGITTGGLIPLYFLANRLGTVENILTVSARSYDDKEKGDVEILYMPKVDMGGKKVLLVDEIADTGDTLKKVSDIILDQYNVGELRTATLAVNTKRCEFYPDLYVFEEKGGWVVFPWEKDEGQGDAEESVQENEMSR